MEEHKTKEIIVEQILEDGLARLRRGECPTEVLTYIVNRTIDESEGKYTDDSFATYDQACKILGIGDRTTLKRYLDKKGVKQKRIGNNPVGFWKLQIYALADKAKNEIKKMKRRVGK